MPLKSYYIIVTKLTVKNECSAKFLSVQAIDSVMLHYFFAPVFQFEFDLPQPEHFERSRILIEDLSSSFLRQ